VLIRLWPVQQYHDKKQRLRYLAQGQERNLHDRLQLSSRCLLDGAFRVIEQAVYSSLYSFGWHDAPIITRLQCPVSISAR
jgi:hypothetical protein